MRVFQFWFSFIWFVAGLCWIRSESAKNFIMFWNFSVGICKALAVSCGLCQTLSLRISRSFSSFVGKVFCRPFRGVKKPCSLVVFVSYKGVRTFSLVQKSSFRHILFCYSILV